MACEDNKNRKCFTFIWKVENADYWWKRREPLESPQFRVDEIHETNWKLLLHFYRCDLKTDLCLARLQDEGGERIVVVDYELAFLSPDGTIQHSFEEKAYRVEVNIQMGSNEFPTRNEVFYKRRSAFLSQDTLTVRCKIWKSNGEISKNTQCHGRTRILVEKKSFLWEIERFNFFVFEDKTTYEVKSSETGKKLLSLAAFMNGGLLCEETIRLKIIPNYETIKISSVHLSILDNAENTVRCFQDEFSVNDPFKNKDFTLPYTVRELMEKKSLYLPNDVLSLFCECSFCFGTKVDVIESTGSDCRSCFDETNDLSVPKGILINAVKSMFNNDMLSDVKLKVGNKTYPAHKLILSCRSPVFRSMFSNDMKEKNSDCVRIDDLSDDTVIRMLRYIYSADVELDWGRAIDLYEAADKYEILDLRDVCSSYLKSNLYPSNACEALLLADLHQDEDFKSFAQDFVLKNAKDIVSSEEWDQLMEKNLKLAAETMRLSIRNG